MKNKNKNLSVIKEETYGKIFNNDFPDVDFYDVLKNSMKDKPFYVGLPKDEKMRNIITYMTNDLIEKVLKEGEVNTIFVQYFELEGE